MKILDQLGLGLLADYYSFVSNTESPISYHRWCFFSMISGLVGRNVWTNIGHQTVYPNQYVLLVGDPGTRKSSAIKIAEKIIRGVGYDKIMTGKTTRDFLLRYFKDQQESEVLEDFIDNLEELEWNNLDENSRVTYAYVIASELASFLGTDNENLLYLLTDLWDNVKIFTDTLAKKPFDLYNPTINILGGTTTQGLMDVFPPSSLNSGIFTRTILVYGDPNNCKHIAFPSPPNDVLQKKIQQKLSENLKAVTGEIKIDKEALIYLEEAYENTPQIEDARFTHYYKRRFTHILKLTQVLAVIAGTNTITADLAIYANTVLAVTESKMERALGTYGLSKDSGKMNILVDTIIAAQGPITAPELWEKLSANYTHTRELAQSIEGLLYAKKIQEVSFLRDTGEKDMGYIPIVAPSNLENKMIALDLLEEFQS